MIFSYNQPTGSPAALLFRTANGDSRGGEHLWKCLSDVESLKLHNGNICFTVYRKPRYLMAKIKKNMVSGENFPNKTNPLNPSTLVRYDITCFDLGFRNVQDILRKSRLEFAVHNHKPSSRIVDVVGGKYSSHLQWSTQPLWLSSWTMRA